MEKSIRKISSYVMLAMVNYAHFGCCRYALLAELLFEGIDVA